jgi:hypothetical protein
MIVYNIKYLRISFCESEFWIFIIIVDEMVCNIEKDGGEIIILDVMMILLFLM